MFLSEYSGKVIPTGEFKTDDFLISLKDRRTTWSDFRLGSERFMSILVNMHHIHTHVLNSVGMSGHMD